MVRHIVLTGALLLALLGCEESEDSEPLTWYPPVLEETMLEAGFDEIGDRWNQEEQLHLGFDFQDAFLKPATNEQRQDAETNTQTLIDLYLNWGHHYPEQEQQRMPFALVALMGGEPTPSG